MIPRAALRSLASAAGPIAALLLLAGPVKAGAEARAPKKLSSFRIYNGQPPRRVVSESSVAGGIGKVTLEPVLQGDVVHHEVRITNESEEPWTLENLRMCSGCMLEGSTKTVAPGESGSITFAIPTDGLGGQTVEGTIRADTNATTPSQLAVDVHLEVREFASLRPYRVWLQGKVGESIQETCIVVPNADYPFEITGIRVRKGVWFEHELRRTEHEGKPAWAIDLRNTRQKPGPYQDVLFVQTDHPARPEFKIRVEGRIEGEADVRNE